MAKISRGEIYPCTVIPSSKSHVARKYNTEVCERYREEEKRLLGDLEDSLGWNEIACNKMDGCIRDLAIARRSWGRNQSQ